MRSTILARMPSPWIERGLVAVGAVLVCAGLFHGLALLWPGVSEPMAPATHAAFVAINLCFGVLFARRVSWLAWPFLALTLHQVWSHGGDLLRAHQEQPPRWDGQSLFTLGGLLVIWALLAARAAARRAGANRR